MSGPRRKTDIQFLTKKFQFRVLNEVTLSSYSTKSLYL